MAENTSLDDKITELSRHLQDQARFTRTVTIICTVSILAMLFWMIVQLLEVLPGAVVLQYMERLPSIVAQWKLAEANRDKLSKPKTSPLPANLSAPSSFVKH